MSKGYKLNEVERKKYYESYCRIMNRIEKYGLQVPSSHRMSKLLRLNINVMRDILEQHNTIHPEQRLNHSHSCVEVYR